MTEDLGSISVGLKVSLGSLQRDLDAIQKKVKPLEAEHLIPFKVGKVSFDAVRKDLDAIAKKAIPISLTATANSGRLIHKELTSQLKAAGPVKVMVSAHLSKAEVNRIRSEITTALRQAAKWPQAPLRLSLSLLPVLRGVDGPLPKHMRQ